MGKLRIREKVYFLFVAILGLSLTAWTVVTYFAIIFSSFTIASVIVNLSTIILLSFLILLVMRYLLLIWCSYQQHLESLDSIGKEYTPSVSIMVPAHNEGPGIGGAIQSLLQLNYPFVEIIIINDGSTDDTLREARSWEGTYRNAEIRVLNNEKNIGKAASLNRGIKAARGEIILCMDGDSRLEPQAVMRGASHFHNPEIAAVAGNVKIINRVNFLTRLQSLEYIEGLNLVRRSQGFFKAVNIIPGPIGFFRKEVLEKVGGYDTDTFAEDCDLTVKILAGGGKISYEPEAVSWTEAPETVVNLFIQRYRWTRGILQALRKHKSSLFNFKNTGLINVSVLFYMAFEAVVWPVMNIFGHMFFLYVALYYGAIQLILLWWAILTLLDMIAALHSIAIEEEELNLVFYALPYRLFFVLAVDVAKLLSTAEEILGLEMTWGSTERKGRIAEKGAV